MVWRRINENGSTLLHLPLALVAESYKIIFHNKTYGRILIAPLMPSSHDGLHTFKSIIAKSAFAKNSFVSNSPRKSNIFQGNVKGIKSIEGVYHSVTKHNVVHKVGYCGIYSGEDCTLLGGVGIVPKKVIGRSIHSCDLSLHILPDYQASELEKDVLENMLDHAFLKVGIKEVHGSVHRQSNKIHDIYSDFGFTIGDIGDYKHCFMHRDAWQSAEVNAA